jgi:DNA-binding FadR family transcriptional regulator
MEAMNTALGSEARVLELIGREIAEHDIRPGGRLPTERDLAQRSGQSRTVVRRALGILEAEGRIVRHIGRGTFLAPPGRSQDAGGAAATSPAEVMAVRLLIEPQMVPLAVVAATPADIAEIQRCLDGGEAAEGYEDFEMWDVALHRACAAATHNNLLMSVMQMINGAREHPLWGTLKRRSSTPERRQAYKRDHRDIARALTERNAEAGQAAMRQHLLRVRANILSEHV